MSGIEIFGLAAGIIQIAEIGSRLSIELCTFYTRAKQADSRLQSLSNDVALTSNVLRQLGDNLQQDDQAKLYSSDALSTAQEVLQECKAVFEKIGDTLRQSSEGNSGKDRFQVITKRLKFMMVEKDLDFLRSNLDRLKSTMLLLLNVIMYAGQVRSRAESRTLTDQRDLIKELVEKKKADESKIESLKDLFAKSLNTQNAPQDDKLPLAPVSEKLQMYCSLVQRIISQIDACQSSLEQTQYFRVRNGILQIHQAEISQSEITDGHEVAQFLRERLAILFNKELVLENKRQTIPAPESNIIQGVAHPKVVHPMVPNPSVVISPGSTKVTRNSFSMPIHGRYPLAPPRIPSEEKGAPEVDSNEEPKHVMNCPAPDIIIDHAPPETSRWELSEGERRPTHEYSGFNSEGNPNKRIKISEDYAEAIQSHSGDSNETVSTGTYRCQYPGCAAPPFQTQYILE
ncbi:hypothetical protein FQN54_000530 [Arachnomyces sp. PD_36]|nr:hypothetical protein FQN54_000530 [Arachnomyces sp. PD_36]